MSAIPHFFFPAIHTVDGLRTLNDRYRSTGLVLSTLVLNEFGKSAATSDVRLLDRMYNMAHPDVRIRTVQAVYDRHFAHLDPRVVIITNPSLVGRAHVAVGDPRPYLHIPVAATHVAVGGGHARPLPSPYGSIPGAGGPHVMPGSGRR